jgi:catechol 2,3-dioxygenase-like lactoylglutathione lyase family enzyme
MHVELATLVVQDYDAAIRFVVDALGFDLEDSASPTDDDRAKRLVAVRPPGAATGLLLAQADSSLFHRWLVSSDTSR